MNPFDKERIGEAQDAAADAEEEAARLRTELEEAKAAIALLRSALLDVARCHDVNARGDDLYWVGEASFVLIRKALEATREYDEEPGK